MKCEKNPLFLLAVVLSVGSILPRHGMAQSYTNLYSFTGTNDGAHPRAPLILLSNTLYGTTAGDDHGYGSVFAINTTGTGFTQLYSFTAPSASYPATNSDGAMPRGGLVASGNTLYGTASRGGDFGYGTVFALNIDGTGFTNLHSFQGYPHDGATPYSGLVLLGDTLYGTTRNGGGSLVGTVFAIKTNGTGLSILHNFSSVDGVNPDTALIVSGNTLYGTTESGGAFGYGAVFALNIDGTGFKTLHGFIEDDNGVSPTGSLVLWSNMLYGTTSGWVSTSQGTIFAINTNGAGFTTLYRFSGGVDGRNPAAGMVLSATTLYGTVEFGGNSSSGVLFAINTDGTGFSTVRSFAGARDDGSDPEANLILSGNTLYGTTYSGGNWWIGSLFKLSLGPITPPQLALAPLGGNLILSWPADATGFTLQSTTNLGPSAVWTTNLPPPIVVTGQYVVTNPVSGAQQFFRLSQ
jgi:uncharacterized repeat protein (TIGR03803 family)